MLMEEGKNRKESQKNRPEKDAWRMEDRNVWNAFAHCLSLIKGEYGRNATLKAWINKGGGGGGGGCVRILVRATTDGGSFGTS